MNAGRECALEGEPVDERQSSSRLRKADLSTTERSLAAWIAKPLPAKRSA